MTHLPDHGRPLFLVLVGVMMVLLLFVAPPMTTTVFLSLQDRGGIDFILTNIVSLLSFLIVVVICCRIGGGAWEQISLGSEALRRILCGSRARDLNDPLAHNITLALQGGDRR